MLPIIRSLELDRGVCSVEVLLREAALLAYLPNSTKSLVRSLAQTRELKVLSCDLNEDRLPVGLPIVSAKLRHQRDHKSDCTVNEVSRRSPVSYD